MIRVIMIIGAKVGYDRDFGYMYPETYLYNTG